MADAVDDQLDARREGQDRSLVPETPTVFEEEETQPTETESLEIDLTELDTQETPIPEIDGLDVQNLEIEVEEKNVTPTTRIIRKQDKEEESGVDLFDLIGNIKPF